jgi:hypothetical protein
MIKYLWGLLFCCSSLAWGIELSSSTLEMGSRDTRLSFSVKNNSSLPQSYILSAKQVDFPDPEAKEIPEGNDLLFSPAKLELLPASSGSFGLVFNGDRKTEHYYYLTVEEASSQQTSSGLNHQLAMNINSAVSIILLIRPEEAVFKNRLEGSQIKNLGNSYSVVLLDEECGQKESGTFYLKPGRSFDLKNIDKRTNVSVLEGKKIKPLLEQCKSN